MEVGNDLRMYATLLRETYADHTSPFSFYGYTVALLLCAGFLRLRGAGAVGREASVVAAVGSAVMAHEP